ncbi:MAG: YciI family protein [Psychroflexus sp.]
MKVKNLVLFLASIALISACQNTKNQSSELESKQVEEDSKLKIDSITKAELDADDYGMKTYVIAFLKSGQNDSLSQEDSDRLLREHLQNIEKLAEDNTLVLAGPFISDSLYRGIFIFNVRTIEKAKTLTETDPAIQAGVFEVEYKTWYGSGTLPLINDLHQQIQNKNPSGG